MDLNTTLLRAAHGDMDAAKNYRRLAELHPEQRDEYLLAAAESDASACRNIAERGRRYGARRSAS